MCEWLHMNGGEQHPFRVWCHSIRVLLSLQYFCCCCFLFFSILQRYKFTSPVLSWRYLDCSCCSLFVHYTQFWMLVSLSTSLSLSRLLLLSHTFWLPLSRTPAHFPSRLFIQSSVTVRHRTCVIFNLIFPRFYG